MVIWGTRMLLAGIIILASVLGPLCLGGLAAFSQRDGVTLGIGLVLMLAGYLCRHPPR